MGLQNDVKMQNSVNLHTAVERKLNKNTHKKVQKLYRGITYFSSVSLVCALGTSPNCGS